jgi:hypothetical protein
LDPNRGCEASQAETGQEQTSLSAEKRDEATDDCRPLKQVIFHRHVSFTAGRTSLFLLAIAGILPARLHSGLDPEAGQYILVEEKPTDDRNYEENKFCHAPLYRTLRNRATTMS